MELKFRDLTANDIECRLSIISQKGKGVSLLLYKNARCDMRILDETVSPFGWQREHKELKGNIYCGVSIKDTDTGEWITKWDCGTESYTEKEKGESSDSFKRACFNWGIGRELYTPLLIWIKPEDLKKYGTDNSGKYICGDRFNVKWLKVENGIITQLIIFNETTKQDCFIYGIKKNEVKINPKIQEIEELAEIKGVGISKIEQKYGVKVITALTDEQIEKCLTGLRGM